MVGGAYPKRGVAWWVGVVYRGGRVCSGWGVAELARGVVDSGWGVACGWAWSVAPVGSILGGRGQVFMGAWLSLVGRGQSHRAGLFWMGRGCVWVGVASPDWGVVSVGGRGQSRQAGLFWVGRSQAGEGCCELDLPTGRKGPRPVDGAHGWGLIDAVAWPPSMLTATFPLGWRRAATPVPSGPAHAGHRSARESEVSNSSLVLCNDPSF